MHIEAISLGEPPAGMDRVIFNINRALAYRALEREAEFEAEVRKVERWQIEQGEHKQLILDAAVHAFRRRDTEAIESLRGALARGETRVGRILRFPIFTELMPADTLREALARPPEER